MQQHYLIRASRKADGPELFDLLLNHSDSFRHDHLDVSNSFVASIAGSDELLTVELNGQVTGFFLVTDVLKGLHCQAHFMVLPNHWKGWVKDEVVESYLDTVWARYNVVKLKATVMASQVEQETQRRNHEGKPERRLKPLGKMLKRLKFFRLWMQVDEYLVNGKLCNGIAYELRRAFWHRERKRQKAR